MDPQLGMRAILHIKDPVFAVQFHSLHRLQLLEYLLLESNRFSFLHSILLHKFY